VVVIDKNETTAARGGHITAFNSKLHKEMGIEVDTGRSSANGAWRRAVS
jgi:hypothetical protein